MNYFCRNLVIYRFDRHFFLICTRLATTWFLNAFSCLNNSMISPSKPMVSSICMTLSLWFLVLFKCIWVEIASFLIILLKRFNAALTLFSASFLQHFFMRFLAFLFCRFVFLSLGLSTTSLFIFSSLGTTSNLLLSSLGVTSILTFSKCYIIHFRHGNVPPPIQKKIFWILIEYFLFRYLQLIRVFSSPLVVCGACLVLNNR